MSSEIQAPQNISVDLKRLVLIDSNNLLADKAEETLTEKTMLEKGIENYKVLISDLYSLLEKQHGEEEENLDYDLLPDEVILPESGIKLPRSMPVPKEKPLTKWEKYKREKGIIQKKRSRFVYSEIAQDWVPRWGKGSAKKIAEEVNWAMEEKEDGVNPFEERANKKALAKAKQLKRQVRNEMRAREGVNEERKSGGKMNKGSGRDVGGGVGGADIERGENKREKGRKGGKLNGKNMENKVDKAPNVTADEKKDRLSKKQYRKMKEEKEKKKMDEDKKNLNKRLEQVQRNTRSMGKFDKKLRNEKEVNFLKKKRISKEIVEDFGKEQKRNKRILEHILKG